MGGNMIFRRTVVWFCLACFAVAGADLLNFNKIRSYAKYLDWDTLGTNSSGNELWSGIIKDCSRKMSFSCIQKNAYSYLEDTFVERDNITVFGGFVLRRNNLDFETMTMRSEEKHNNVDENLVENSSDDDRPSSSDDHEPESRIHDSLDEEIAAEHREEYKKSPLEEITSALHEKTIKFLATRDYELQLPEFFFEGSTVKISPREIDEKGALIRLDFGQRDLENHGRLFKKIKKFIQNKLLVSFLALILIIKLVTVKFLFVLPVLLGVGTAKKLFLKLVLFLVPAFGHVFKLCSSYYASHGPKFHHHHHQIAHHHHHVPVPVPVPTYYEPHHHPHHEDGETYDYPPPHIQLNRDMAELAEWGIKPDEEIFDDPGPPPIPHRAPPFSSPFPDDSLPYPPAGLGPRPPGPNFFPDKFNPGPIGSHGQHLAFNSYIDDHKFKRRISAHPPLAAVPRPQLAQASPGPVKIKVPAASPVNSATLNGAPSLVKTYPKTVPNGFSQNANAPHQANIQETSRPAQQLPNQRPTIQQPVDNSVVIASPSTQSDDPVIYDDAFYGPIIHRLEDIFVQLRFVKDNCRERLICSMYKNPQLYSPHSNHVSNELSREPEELKRGNAETNSSHVFHWYLKAARLGQDGGDCLRTYPCQINTE